MRVSHLLMDYPHRQRLKIYARAEIVDVTQDEALATRLALPNYSATVERAILFHLEAFGWNCPQHITPPFSESKLVEVLAPMRARLQALEEENGRLRGRIGTRTQMARPPGKRGTVTKITGHSRLSR